MWEHALAEEPLHDVRERCPLLRGEVGEAKDMTLRQEHRLVPGCDVRSGVCRVGNV